MKYKILTIILITIFGIFTDNYAQKNTDANIFGDVQSDGEHLPFITIVVKGTTIGTTTDATGHYMLVNLPVGKHVVRVQGIGYKPFEKEVEVFTGESVEVNFNLQRDILSLEQVVVSANRNDIDRGKSPVIINVVSPRMFEAVQAVSLSEGLNFTPGLRVETNCQNCGFTQLRMNGLDGSYSQILINSRPVFSALAGVYGLEQIPANMIERVEVIRGGGSALFGGNAIAGTINIITKDPINNTFNVASNLAMINSEAPDASVNFSSSIVTDDRKSGIFITGMARNRDHWDANNDSFSEITRLESNSIGFRAFHRPSDYSRLSFDFYNIKEFRRGGNKFELLPHQADITEQLEHDILTGGLAYEAYSPNYRNKYSVYVSVQDIKRDSYYGARDPDAYGKTSQMTAIAGGQYAREFNRFLVAPSQLTTGIEIQTSTLTDEKLSSETDDQILIADQDVSNIGIYLQNQWDFEFFRLLLGIRTDKHNLLDYPVFNPRTNVLFDVTSKTQLRLSYARGFRAPQIFDEDLHIELAGAKAIRRTIDPELKEETSDSFSGSVDYTGNIAGIESYFLLEGFHTILNNAFVTSLELDDNDEAFFFKTNGAGAKVSGINLEAQFAPSAKYQFQFGFTLQNAVYNEDEVIWEPESGNPDSVVAISNILRSPNDYGYFTATFRPVRPLSVSLTGSYTGRMYTPHMIDAETTYTVIRQTPTFLDAGIRVAYSFSLTREVKLELSTGLQNIFNSYQDDFDTGVERDAAYIYGPARPRTILFGLRIGNF